MPLMQYAPEQRVEVCQQALEGLCVARSDPCPRFRLQVPFYSDSVSL